MNNPTNFSAGQTGPNPAIAFTEFFNAKRNRRPRPVNWFRIISKLLAFAAGCLISLGFGLYGDDSLSAPKAQAATEQTALSAPGQ